MLCTTLALDTCISILEAALHLAAAWTRPGVGISMKLVKNRERENNKKKISHIKDSPMTGKYLNTISNVNVWNTTSQNYLLRVWQRKSLTSKFDRNFTFSKKKKIDRKLANKSQNSEKRIQFSCPTLLPSQGRGKVCAHSTLPIPHFVGLLLWTKEKKIPQKFSCFQTQSIIV